MITDFIERYQLDPKHIDGPACIDALMKDMAQGLEGSGNIPMNPSYLSLDTKPQTGIPCCIIDAGGTNLRSARAIFRDDGTCRISGLTKAPMLGLEEELSSDDFYSQLAGYVHRTGETKRIGLCFSYNVEHQRMLDGILQSWCKEVRVPEAVGKPVGESLRKAVGPDCSRVHVVNDSTAALLGAHYCNNDVTVGVILGTGINICYSELCSRIPKVPRDLSADSMIISTEIGEFSGIPKTVFEQAVIAASDEPQMAHGEKQCSGAYLGEIISRAWQTAAEEGLLPACFGQPVTLPEISCYLSGDTTSIPDDPQAKQIASLLIRRAAKIAAILTAGVLCFSHQPGQHCTMVVEGSQYEKLHGFSGFYKEALEALLQPYGVTFTVTQQEGSCLTGAALSAFAQPM